MTVKHSSSWSRATRVMVAATALLLAGSVTALVAFERGGSKPDLLAPVQDVSIGTSDFAFDMPTTLRPGLTQFSLSNKGQEMHHLWIVKLEQGKTLADVFAALKAGGPFPTWAKNIGGPNASAPGAKAVALLELDEGRYAAICFIPSPDGVPHAMKGMAKEFEVTGEPIVAAAPKIDIEASLTDYDFTFSKPITAGRQTIRFTNNASQPHEAFIAKLAPGKKAADLVAWIVKPEGPPPGTPMGGLTGIESGRSLTISQDFEPGTYALYCFVPDAKDGKEHIAHGMVKEIVVAER